MPISRRAASKEAAITAKVHEAIDEVAEVADAQIARVEKKRRARLHPIVQFPLAATLSFATASLGYSLLGEFSKGELAAVSRSQDTWVEVGVLAGWRLVELGLGWFGRLDSWDVAMLDLLSHGPALYLLMTFYSLNPWTAGAALAVDVLSAALPFHLLRPLSTVHTPSAASLPNRELIDVGLQLYTTALAAVIYTVTIVLSLRFLLPRSLVLYFAGLQSLDPAYSASYATVLPVTLLFGAAASTFIFAPFATTEKSAEDDKLGDFNPVDASLQQTVQWNMWGYTAKTKVIIRRTLTAMLVTGLNTYLALTMTIYGIDSAGAILYAGVWAAAAMFTGVGLRYVGAD